MSISQPAVDVRLDLPRHPTAPSLARLRVRNLRGLPDRSRDTVELLVTELVTNAIIHSYGTGQVGVHVVVDDRKLRLEVDDGAEPRSTFRRVGRPSTTDPGGRGLFLVQELSSRWGVDGESSNVVWCELDLH